MKDYSIFQWRTRDHKGKRGKTNCEKMETPSKNRTPKQC